ncbi:MAG TPA: hypothetical protein VF097_07220 [Actinomycetota bacterium]
MRAEFLRPEDPETVVGTVEWDGVRVTLRADDESRATLQRVFRVSSVPIDDPSRRALGTSGPVLAEPGDLDWFLAAARVRGRQEGLTVRLVPGTAGGWDPAGAYRRMGDWIGEREASARETHPASGR